MGTKPEYFDDYDAETLAGERSIEHQNRELAGLSASRAERKPAKTVFSDKLMRNKRRVNDPI